MINDITPPQAGRGPKPKRIEPLAKTEGPPLHEQAKAIDPSFKTPAEAAGEEPSPILPMVVDHQPSATTPAKPKRRWWPRSRKWQIVCSLAIVLLAVGAGAGWTLTHHKRAVVAAPPKHKVVKKATPPPPVYSTLTGLQVPDASYNNRTVTAVMIENSLDARPQSGLGDAGVVFEAVAEGGVTRFLALFQDTAPTNIGPIRSARPYYVQWALGFDAAYAHVGGSADALADIISWGVKDMNQFYNGAYYHRTTDRAAPHNVYTSMAKLNELENNKGYTSHYTGFTRTTKDAPAATPTASSIDFHLSGYIYDPHYDYAASSNSYNRVEAGEAHMDANTGKQISPKVVIAMVVPLSQGALDATGAYYSNYNVLGSGTAYVFQNGTVTQAVWNKADNAAPLSFTDANGVALPLMPGQTWITAVSGSGNVTYK